MRPDGRLDEAGAGAPADSALPGAKSQAQSPPAARHGTVKRWAPHAPAVEDVEIPPPRPRGMTDKKRVIQEWNGARFVRNQSFLAAVEQIVNRSKVNDVVKIGIVGDMGTGKTTLAQAIAHAFHARIAAKHKIPFAVRVFGAKELADLDGTLRDLPHANYVVSFDDVSFMDANTSARQIATIKRTLTTIRHREGGHDVKFVLIYGYHYGRGLDKFLRQTDFTFWTAIGAEEAEYVEGRFRSKRATSIIRDFQRQAQEAISQGRWTARYSNDGRHVYKYRDPFIPLLFGTGGAVRQVIGPTREFMQERCHTCSVGTGAPDEIDPAVFWNDAVDTLGASNARQALRYIGLENGIVALPRGVLGAKRAIEASLRERHVDLHRLLATAGIYIEPPHKRASHDRFVSSIRAAPGCPAEVKQARAERAKKAAGKKAPGRAQKRKPTSPQAAR